MSDKILIPLLCYNYGRFLPECLDSIIRQTYQDWKVVVCDPQSTDETKQVMSHYVAKDSRITYIRETGPLTVGTVRNRAINENSDFPIIAYHDVDDIMMLDRLERSIRAISDAHIIYGNMESFGLYRNIINSFPYVNFKLLLNYNLIMAPTVCFRYEVWRDIGGFDESMKSASDYDFWLRAAKAGFKFKYMNQVLTLYRTHLSSITSHQSKYINIFHRKGRETPDLAYARSKHTSKHVGIRTAILWLLAHTWQRVLTEAKI